MQCKSYSHFFSKTIRKSNTESTKTVNEMALNELVKLTTLWKTGLSTWTTEGQNKDITSDINNLLILIHLQIQTCSVCIRYLKFISKTHCKTHIIIKTITRQDSMAIWRTKSQTAPRWAQTGFCVIRSLKGLIFEASFNSARCFIPVITERTHSSSRSISRENGLSQAKRCLRICAKYTQSIIRAFILFVLSNDFVSGQWRPWSDCAYA